MSRSLWPSLHSAMTSRACRLLRAAGGVALAGAAPLTFAASPATLPGIVVVGERQVDGTPAAIDRVRVDAIPARPQRSVSELLQRVPGVAAHDRQNLAQDVQLTIRGFGARSAFGVRGLRIFADGIPATMPDGQGQVSHIPLEALSHVDVLRGPFSALYGNASGGVIEFSSADPPKDAGVGVRVAAGSDGLEQQSLSWTGPWNADPHAGEGYRVDAGHMDLDGYRQHSRAHRVTRQARLVVGTALDTRIAFTANALDLDADDPQGLTLAQAISTPRAASAGAIAFDARKNVRQQQAGVRVEQPLGERQSVSATAWGGTRTTFQMLSVPVSAQAAPGSGGGVVDLDRTYSGVDLRWHVDGSVAGRALGLTAGVESQRASEHRLGHENFVGNSLGVVGALRRDQQDVDRNRDTYAEARFALSTQWSATLGVRHSEVDFDSRDAYIAPGNPDDSGALRFAQTTPVFGLSWRLRPWLEMYGNAGRGFETPSFAELAYRSDGQSGLNDALRPARSRNVEAGLRSHRGGHTLEVTAFQSRTRDELVVAANIGGRTTYDNAANTQRRGLEVSADGPIADRWHYALAYSRLDARYQSDFSTCRAPPCAVPDTLVDAGNRIPATSPQSLWAEVRWAPRPDIDVFAQANAVGRTYADDANTAHAAGYATFDVGVQRRWHIGQASLEAFARLDNVLDRHAIGSVIVGDANGRYFEPAPGRGWQLGVSLQR